MRTLNTKRQSSGTRFGPLLNWQKLPGQLVGAGEEPFKSRAFLAINPVWRNQKEW